MGAPLDQAAVDAQIQAALNVQQANQQAAIDAAVAAAIAAMPQPQGAAQAAQQANQQAAIDAAVAAAIAALPQPQGAAPNPIAFALAPGGNNGLIDYQSRGGSKIQETAHAPLPSTFDLSTEKLNNFLEEVSDRSGPGGYSDILDVPIDAIGDPLGPTENLCKGYAKVSVEQAVDWAQTYTGQQVRGAQDDYNLYQGLRASLTEEAKTNLLQFSNIYTVNNNKSGIVYLRIIVRESHIDTAYSST